MSDEMKVKAHLTLTLILSALWLWVKAFFAGAIIICGISTATYYICVLWFGMKF